MKYMNSVRREVLACRLFDKMIELKNNEVSNLKEYGIAFQEVIQDICPEKCWWDVSDCRIFMHLMEHKDPEATVIEILKQLKEE